MINTARGRLHALAFTLLSCDFLNGSAQITRADTTATPAPDYKIQHTGLIDIYYLLQSNNPHGNTTLTGRVYDVRHNAPTLAMAELNVFQIPRPHGLGFKTTLSAGDDTDINHYDFQNPNGGAGEARFKAIQQAYISYALDQQGDGLDFGKMTTPFGYEAIEASGNFNYSHSIPFGDEPTYHFGARAYTGGNALGVSGLTLTGYLVKAIFNSPTAGVQDDNKQPAFLGQVVYASPNGKLSLTSTVGGGTDKFDLSTFNRSDVNASVFLTDNDITYNINPSEGVGLNYMYAQLKPNTGGTQELNGYGVYFHRAVATNRNVGLRFSTVGLNAGGPVQRPYEFTATYSIKSASNVLTFLELRHDGTNISNSFLGSTGLPTQKAQDTVTLASVYQF